MNATLSSLCFDILLSRISEENEMRLLDRISGLDQY